MAIGPKVVVVVVDAYSGSADGDRGLLLGSSSFLMGLATRCVAT